MLNRYWSNLLMKRRRSIYISFHVYHLDFIEINRPVGIPRTLNKDSTHENISLNVDHHRLYLRHIDVLAGPCPKADGKGLYTQSTVANGAATLA